MRQLCDEQQISLLWATHLIDEVSDTDQVLVLHRGQLIADGVAAELVSQSGTSDIRQTFQYLIDHADSKSDSI
jgi:ABC-2 type transport system ATP-binding protein